MDTLKKIFGAVIDTFFVTTSGASISQVGRIQAENKQANDGFWSTVSDASKGVFKEKISFLGGVDSKPQVLEVATITPDKIREIDGVAIRNTETAVLMHGVKLFQELRKRLESMDLRHLVAESMPQVPVRPLHEVVELPPAPTPPTRAQHGTVCNTDAFMELDTIDEMVTNLKSEVIAQFDFAFWKEAQSLNSRAAARGKLISANGAFFRQLVQPLPKGDKHVTANGVVVTQWEKSYDEETLSEFSRLRDELQAEYNDLQKQLNGYRKQIKDAVRAHNLDEERRYQADWGAYTVAAQEHAAQVEHLQLEEQHRYEAALETYRVETEKYHRETERVRSATETLRQVALQEMAGLRVRTE